MTPTPRPDRPYTDQAYGRSACPDKHRAGSRRWPAAALTAVVVGAALIVTGTSAMQSPGKPGSAGSSLFGRTDIPPHSPAQASPPAPAATPQEPASAPTPSAGATADQSAASATGPDLSAAPVRVRISAIGVDSGLEPLEIGADGQLGTPLDPDRAGWWADGPNPGSPGASVVVGHLDSRTGPAVFYRLGSLRPGDRIEVLRADGTTAAFSVSQVHSYAKSDFPSDAVYGASAGPTLRLVTCGGSYDKRRHAYTDNVVVFADPTPPTSEAVAQPVVRGQDPPRTTDGSAPAPPSPESRSRS
ncbi:hypothetical protein GCM10023205_68310 [Yinghuangia aomiensis]|uniref:Sortase family protein n=1 Tax=Yinghuangia aomiensis TaxID=676205 RepID=A0ABP9I4A3_9ACTN